MTEIVIITLDVLALTIGLAVVAAVKPRKSQSVLQKICDTKADPL